MEKTVTTPCFEALTFQFLFLSLCCFPGNCIFLYWVVLRVILADQIQQVLH